MKDSERGFIDWTPNAASGELPNQILTVIQTYRDQGVPAPTVRDVFYEVRSRYGYKKTEAFRRKVYYLLRMMRRVKRGPYKIHFHEIDDDSPTMLTGTGYENPGHFWRSVKRRAERYGRNLAQGQYPRVIVMTEGAGSVRQLRTVSRPYDIPVYSGGGWESIRFKHDLAQDALNGFRRSGRHTLALHCGDFDADGQGIFDGIEDVRAFVEGLGGADPEEIFQVERLMLTHEQVLEHVPDEDRDYIDRSKIKDKDHRGKAWPYPYKCELQALHIPARLEILRRRLEELVDNDQLSAVREQGEAEREEILGRIDELLDDE